MDPIRFESSRPEPEELIAFYERQEHSVTHEVDKIRRMIERTFCIVTAQRRGEIVGLARGVTDGLTGWLAECKLDPALQGPACITRTDGRVEHDSSGIAREMARMVIRALRDQGAERIEVVAYGTEEDFCEELGFKRVRGVEVLELTSGTPLPDSTLAAPTATVVA